MQKSNFERYKNYCDAIETTPLYVEFSFYSLIAACLQRRVWCSTGDWKIFSNLYFVFVGEPATGKTNAARVNINILNRLTSVNPKTKDVEQVIPTAPDTISVEALIRKLAFGLKIFTDAGGQPHAMSPITFISEELGNLFKKDDQQLVKFLIQGYDCGNFKKELKGSEKVNTMESVSNLCLNFLAATTPANMLDFMHRGLMEDGFLGRALFIYGGYPRKKILFFNPTPDQIYDLAQVEQHCRNLTNLVGPCTLTDEAEKFLMDWLQNSNQVINEDRRLQFYYSRKKINVIKLAIVIHFSECCDNFQITKKDVEMALAALARAEVDMHLALSSSAKNPIYNLAEMILSFLCDRKRRHANTPDKYRKRVSELQLIFNAEGDSMQVTKAVEYLVMAKRVIVQLVNGELFYEAPEQRTKSGEDLASD